MSEGGSRRVDIDALFSGVATLRIPKSVQLGSKY